MSEPRAWRAAQARMSAHQARVCSCVDAVTRNPDCSIHGDRADIGRSANFVCPACVQFGRTQCAEHRATSVHELERLINDPPDGP